MLDVHSGYIEMLARALSGWVAFTALILFIYDRRSYEFRTPGSIGVQALAFGMFWYSIVSTFASTALIGKAFGYVSWWFAPKFTTSEVWFYMMLGDVVINLSIASIAFACRMNASTRKGRRYMRGKLE